MRRGEPEGREVERGEAVQPLLFYFAANTCPREGSF